MKKPLFYRGTGLILIDKIHWFIVTLQSVTKGVENKKGPILLGGAESARLGNGLGDG